MRPSLVPILVFCLSLLLAPALGAAVNISCTDPPESTASFPGSGAGKSLSAKLDRGTPRLLLPYFEVDMNDPNGVTTLFAVRNLVDVSFSVRTVYFTLTGVQQQTSTTQTIDSKETITVNVRNVAENFQVDQDGIARGLALVEVPDFEGDVLRLMGGDFFLVTGDEDFATGDRLLNIYEPDTAYYDLCSRSETRFLNGGAFTGGTTLTLFSDSVGGAAGSNPPTFTITIFDEAGNEAETCQVRTDQITSRIAVDELTDVPFGTAEVQFQVDEGQILADFSAQNRFSVGMRGLCTDSSP